MKKLFSKERVTVRAINMTVQLNLKLIFWVVVLGCAVGLYAFFHRHIRLPDADPTCVSISMNVAYKSDEVPVLVTIHSPEQIRLLVDCLKSGRRHADHKCGNKGSIMLRYENAELRIDFLPGHNSKYYEIRYNRNNFRIDRSRFIEVLNKLGVPAEKIPWSC